MILVYQFSIGLRHVTEQNVLFNRMKTLYSKSVRRGETTAITLSIEKQCIYTPIEVPKILAYIYRINSKPGF